MNKDSDVYLTMYSLLTLSNNFDLDDFSNLTRTFLDIDIDLTQYFNRNELISMNKINMLCNSYIDECVRLQIETSTKYEKNYKERLIYPTQPPSFHYTKGCEFLNSNYENFEIPVEIKYEDIEEYRKFFLENIDLYKKNKEYFFARVEMKFNVKINYIREDKGRNSTLARFGDTTPLLITNLLRAKEDLDKMREGNENAFYNNRYIPYRKIKEIKAKKSEDIIEKDAFILEMSDLKYKFRIQIIDYLIGLYYQDEMKFKESTLQALGAKPCKACLRQSNLLMA